MTAFGVETIKSDIKPIVKGNRLSFEVNVKSDGYLSAENWSTNEKAFDNKFLEKVEKTTAKTVKKRWRTLQKNENRIQSRSCRIRKRDEDQASEALGKLKKNWDETFTDIPITFHVQITIKEYGTVGDQ